MIIKTSPSYLSRRALLRGVGGTAIALPFLESMGWGAAPPKRFVIFFSENGTSPNAWMPAMGTPINLDPAGRFSAPITQMPAMLAPLEPYRSKLLQLKGVHLLSADADGNAAVDVGHGMPKAHLLTVANSVGNGEFGGRSIDQELAVQIGGATKFRSLSLGVQVVSGKGITAEGPGKTIAPINDPRTVFSTIFKDLGVVQTDPAVVRARARQHTILDAVKADYTRLQKRLGAADRQRIDGHLESIRSIEQGIDVVAPVVACSAPDVSAAPVDKTDWRTGPVEDFYPIGKVQMELLAKSLACDLTRVATIQWEGNGVYSPWLGSSFTTDHHSLSHSSDDNPLIITIQNWYAQHFAYLLKLLDGIPEGNGTLLDNTVVLWASEIGTGGAHYRGNIPWILAGGGGGYFKTGRFVDYRDTQDRARGPQYYTAVTGGVSHGRLMVSLLNAMGVPASSFGQPQFSSGPLPGLT